VRYNPETKEGQMKYTALSIDVNLRPEGFLVDLDSLFAALATLSDRRDARGLRYALVTVLVYIVMAKLAGEDHLRGIAQWVALRQEALARVLGLAKPQAPHATTYSRVLRKAVHIEELEQVTRDFFASQPKAGKSVVLNLDGKTLRGTIPTGKTKGIHLLAAYLPEEGWVLYQVEVGSWENEIPAAMRILRRLDLRGKIVTGDALLAQRELSTHIVEAGGDYVWKIKGNQSRTQEDIELLFAPESCVPGFSPSPKDFRAATTREKGHGRLERRTLTASSLLKDYVNWPYAKQVFRIKRRFLRIQDGKRMEETKYGVTSLTAAEASPERLLELVRAHWSIENGLHYRRDETFREDRCRLTGQGARAMAVLNNLVLGLLRRTGVDNLPDARRHYAAHLEEAAALVLHSPAPA
jgi:predicted transposase YbfD/YdcC